jgi:PD-(D/E)XK endonuclease
MLEPEVVGDIYAVVDETHYPATGRRRHENRRGAGEFVFRTFKEQGEWAELCFMARARQLGLTVLKPYGDSSAYDVGIEIDGRLLRVQTKSTTYQRDGRYICNLTGSGRKPYPEGSLDYFAIYLIPMDIWYILPFEKARNTMSMQFTPGKPGHKYEAYREAWHLLRETM